MAETEEAFVLRERFITADPATGSAWLAASRGAIDARAFLTTFSLSSADGKLVDIEGVRAVGDLANAFLVAELALDHMVDACLDARGKHAIRIPKWRMRPPREVEKAENVRERRWVLKRRAHTAETGLERWIDDVVVENCQELLEELGADVYERTVAERAAQR